MLNWDFYAVQSRSSMPQLGLDISKQKFYHVGGIWLGEVIRDRCIHVKTLPQRRLKFLRRNYEKNKKPTKTY